MICTSFQCKYDYQSQEDEKKKERFNKKNAFIV